MQTITSRLNLDFQWGNDLYHQRCLPSSIVRTLRLGDQFAVLRPVAEIHLGSVDVEGFKKMGAENNVRSELQ